MRRIFPFLSVLGLWVAAAAAESSDSASVRMSHFVDNIAAFNHLLPQEKVYLHFDNTSYFIGETIWFKAYVVTAPEHRATNQSRILHVELITREGTIVDRRKLKIENGQCWGEFELKKEYQSGYYEVRAYTHAMLNFGMIQQPYEKEINAFFFNEDYTRRFFQESGTAFSRVFPVYCEPREPGLYREKTIRVRPKVTGKNEPKNPPEKRPEIVFYPEGGQLVRGLMSRVAFEARDEEGRWVEVKGTVEGQKKGPDGRSTGSFRTSHRGKGDFYYLPESKGVAKVDIEYKGKSYTYELPEPLDEGYVMTVNRDRKGDFLIDVRRSAGQKDEPLGLSVICRGTPYVFESFNLDEDGRTICVNSGLLPTGVNQVTLFNAEGRVFAERLVFVDHKESQHQVFSVSGISPRYRPYEQVQLSFNLKELAPSDSLQNNSFSLSITDEASRETNYSLQNIRSNLLLSSDLYGFIETPEYYFESTGRRRNYELDLLMLVQGWSRYDWQVMSGLFPFDPQFRIEKSLKVSGRVYPMLGLKSGQKRRLGDGMELEAFMVLDTMQLFGKGMTDEKGVFTIDFPDFEGDATLFVHVNDKKRLFDRNASDFFDYREEGGHWPYEYIPTDVQYSPHVKMLSFYEVNPLLYGQEKKYAEEDTTRVKAQKGVRLKEASVTGSRILHTLDFSQPVMRLNPMDELNLQMDMGMYFGAIERGLIAVNAAVRHGIRGAYEFTFNQRPGSNEYLLSFDRPETRPDGPEEDNPDTYIAIKSWRNEQADYYLRRYMAEMGKPRVDIVGGKIVSTVPYETHLYLEKIDTIRLYADHVNRETFTMHDIESSYTSDFIVDFHFRKEIMPIYKGRRMTYAGYSSVASFYHPDYGSSEPKPASWNDYRRTLYWNPDVSLDADGTANISFYNNEAKHLIISAEGISSEGVPIVYEK